MYFESAEKIWYASREKLNTVPGIQLQTVENIVTYRSQVDLDYWTNQVKAHGIEVITYTDFPEMLTEIYDSPVVLFAKGDLSLLSGPKLAVVGTRKVTGYGIMAVKNLIPPVIEAGLTIVSGLATGVDAWAHEVTVKNSGKTIAVLGNGLDQIYPRENRELAKKIADSGLLLSEYLPGIAPEKHHFPQRNRIISGLSEGVLVIEAPEQSGAMITAQLALEQNRDVFAVPGNINSPCSQGCNTLISEGAKLVSKPEDILTEYNLTVNMLLEASTIQLSLESKNLLEHIPFRETSIDELSLNISGDDIHTMLLELELCGMIMRRMGGYVIRVK